MVKLCSSSNIIESLAFPLPRSGMCLGAREWRGNGDLGGGNSGHTLLFLLFPVSPLKQVFLMSFYLLFSPEQEDPDEETESTAFGVF